MQPTVRDDNQKNTTCQYNQTSAKVKCKKIFERTKILISKVYEMEVKNDDEGSDSKWKDSARD